MGLSSCGSKTPHCVKCTVLVVERFATVWSFLAHRVVSGIHLTNLRYHGILLKLSWRTLERKCIHFDEIFITGCTGSCQNSDNFQRRQWLKFRQNDDIFSVFRLAYLTKRGRQDVSNHHADSIMTTWIALSLWLFTGRWITIISLLWRSPGGRQPAGFFILACPFSDINNNIVVSISCVLHQHALDSKLTWVTAYSPDMFLT